jgi:hypothetical protein
MVQSPTVVDTDLPKQSPDVRWCGGGRPSPLPAVLPEDSRG